MKRIHINLSVADLDKSLHFYSSLFGAEPVVKKKDYAKWMLENPRVNFAISNHGSRKGLDHLGIQVEDEAELGEVYSRLKTLDATVDEQGTTTCCYARSEKSWVMDPEGIAWETFLTRGDSPVYGSDDMPANSHNGACCMPPVEDSSLPRSNTAADRPEAP